MTQVLLTLSIYIWPFGQLLAFTHNAFPFSIYLLDLVTALLFLSLIASRHRKQIFSSPILKPLTVFLGVGAVSLLFNLNRAVSVGLPLSLFYLLRLIIYPSLYFAAGYIGFKKIKIPLLISLVIFSTLGLVQYLFFPDMRYLKYLGFDDHLFRLIGTFYDPNFTGAVLAGVTLFFIAKNKVLYAIPPGVLLALTFSRASFLTFIVGVVYLIFKNKKITPLLSLLLLLLTVFLSPKPFGEGVNLLRSFSVDSRLESWKSGITLFIKKPIIGWGYNTLRGPSNERFQTDNSYIFLLATTGIIGLISYIYLTTRLLKNTQDVGVAVVAYSILFHSLFNNSFFYIWIVSLFWLTLGIGQKRSRRINQS